MSVFFPWKEKVGTWTLKQSTTYSKLYVNEAIRMCILYVNKSGVQGSTTGNVTVDTVSQVANYAPPQAIYSNTTTPAHNCRVTPGGTVELMAGSENGSYAVLTQFKWIY